MCVRERERERERENVMTRAESWLIGFKHHKYFCEGVRWGGGRDKLNNLRAEKKD